jgi:hypothetical protein
LFPKISKPTLGPTQPATQWVLMCVPMVQRRGRDADHLSPFRAAVRINGSLSQLPHLHRDNFYGDIWTLSRRTRDEAQTNLLILFVTLCACAASVSRKFSFDVLVHYSHSQFISFSLLFSRFISSVFPPMPVTRLSYLRSCPLSSSHSCTLKRLKANRSIHVITGQQCRTLSMLRAFCVII